ncbi:MAG: TolC family protein, partial [Candidatus Hydrogenedentes bacterium]|nr:TolC family protein [Candidatus Hydrogenedentota bacterium]
AQLVEQDVRGAYIELRRAREQVSATAATRKLQETVASTEAEKMRLGSSTSLLVARAQRDLLEAQINEVQAAKNFLQAIVNLYRFDGSLLIRRGIACPGAEPIKL